MNAWVDYGMYILVGASVAGVLLIVTLELWAKALRHREGQRDPREGYSLEMLEASIEGDMPYDDAESEYLKAAWEAAVRDHGWQNAQWARRNHGRVGGLRVLNKHTYLNRS
jgi:hypothetical protein